MQRTIAAAGIAVVVLSGFTAPPATRTMPAKLEQLNEILGRWQGTSTCVKADWNASCNNERVVYFFERAPGSATALTVHAYKYVGTTLDSMGDLTCEYDPATKSWVAPFSNGRVRIQWVYQVLPGGAMTGRLDDLINKRVTRNASLRRDSIQTPPPGH